MKASAVIAALAGAILIGNTPAIIAEAGATTPAPPTAPAYCYSTGEWIPFPDYSGYCLDGEAPFYGPAPSYGGGNHRWPDGSDD